MCMMARVTASTAACLDAAWCTLLGSHRHQRAKAYSECCLPSLGSRLLAQTLSPDSSPAIVSRLWGLVRIGDGPFQYVFVWSIWYPVRAEFHFFQKLVDSCVPQGTLRCRVVRTEGDHTTKRRPPPTDCGISLRKHIACRRSWVRHVSESLRWMALKS
jgi:hypothetical protein